MAALLPPERAGLWSRSYAEVRRRGTPAEFEASLDGRLRTISLSLLEEPAVADPGLLLLIRDRWPGRHSEEASLHDRHDLDLALSLARAGIWEADLDSGGNFWSDTAWELYGLQKDNRPASSELWAETVHPEDREMAVEAARTGVRQLGEINIEYRVLSSDGSVRWLMARGLPIFDEAGRASRYIGIVIDVTRRREAELELERRRRHFDIALDHARIGLWDGRLKDHSVERSLEHARIFGYGDALHSWSLEAFLEHVVPEDRDMVDSVIGSSILQELDYDFECRIRRRDGAVRWVASGGTFHTDPISGERHILGVIRDITDVKQAEEERESLRMQLQHSQKLELLGQFAGGIAHDFNNQLTSILGNAELARGVVGARHPVAEHLAAIDQSARRSAELTRQLLAFARKQPLRRVSFDLRPTIENLLGMCRRMHGAGISFEWSPGDEPAWVCVDPSQFDQVLTNLCANAIDAMAGSGTLSVETRRVEVTGRECRAGHVCRRSGSYVRLRVSDTGCGIDAQALPHIFEPFFTTKDVGKGTGLGLATVYGIVTQNGGYLECRSEPGSGAVFSIFFPLADMPPAASPPSAEGVAPAASGKTILVVDDEEHVLGFAGKVLLKAGYRVVTASGPGAALDLAGATGETIDLLLTDVRMPGMDGMELCRRLMEGRPGMRALFMSGYADVPEKENGMRSGNAHAISKPFGARELLEAVSAELSAPVDPFPRG